LIAAAATGGGPLGDVSTWARGSGLEILLVVLGVLLLSRAVGAVGGAVTSRIDSVAGEDALTRSERAKHRHSVAQVLVWLANVLLFSVATVRVVALLGFSITGLVAPAAVLGVALGFGAQRVVQDLLAGFFIIAERQYGFGDVIRVASLGSLTGVSGTVEEISLRITRMRSADGEVIIIPNGQIVQVSNLSRDWARATIDIPLPRDIDVAAAGRVLREACAAAYRDNGFARQLLDEPVVVGIESLTTNQMNVRIVARTLPERKDRVSRELRGQLVMALRTAGLMTPWPTVVPATVKAE
jgi:small conductance mechanosensitive channel